MSNQKATHQVSKGGIKQAVFVLGGLAVASAIYAISQPAETFPNTARFEVTSVTTPTIVRGATGTQTITIQNRGPDAATGTQALIRPQLTTGVTINSVTGPNGACTFSSPDYVCAVGNVANNATFNVSVVYNVALSASAGTSVKQTEIRINSNQFNPGSGMGETSHKVWGALNQESPTTQNGAFWPGRTSTNATCNGTGNTCGTFAGENSALLSAWPINTDAPVGQYVNTPQNGDANDSYFTTTTLQNPTYYRVVDDMANYQYRRLVLPSVSSGTINNRRAWEFRTYVYIPATTSGSFCVGESGFVVDDGSYITLTPAANVPTRALVGVQRDAYQNNIYQVTSPSISAGYYEVVFRVVNQNGNNSNEYAQGGYGPIGMGFGGSACGLTGLADATRAGFPANITIANPVVDLGITKTNNVSSLTNSSSTDYVIRVTNNGPDALTGAVLADPVAAGLTKTAIACTTGVAGNQCTAGTTPTITQIQSGGGYALPTLANSAFYELRITASVSATATSVSNVATIATPTGVTDTNLTNNSATDTDAIQARVRIAKISNNGVGTFNFTGLTNLSNTTDSVTTATSGVSVTSAQSNYSTALNAAVQITESLPLGYSLNSASCTDANAATSGNPASPTTFGSLTGNQLTIPAVNIRAGADILCTFTNTAITSSISGRVFNDNSGSTGVAANAYNGTQQAGELGLAGATIRLTNCAANPAPADVLATTQTDGAGDYSFSVVQPSVPNPFCVVESNLNGYTSVSGTTGYTRSSDSISIAKTAALAYTGHNFGDARLNLILTSNGQQTTTPSGTVSYPHILRSESVLTVGALNTVSTESPTFGWTTVLYRDTNCNGAVDTGESALTSAIGQLLPNQDICVVQRVNAPANATNGAQHVATLSASYTATVQGGAVLNGSSNTRTDTTLVGTAGLDMRKQVRVVASCPSTGADVAAFTERNTAQNGDFLEYQIIYSNRSTRNLSQLTVRDVAPSSTTFQSAICQSTPSGSGCIPPASAGVNGDLAWSLTNIAPAANGSVRFCVRVPPLAEPPIRQ